MAIIARSNRGLSITAPSSTTPRGMSPEDQCGTRLACETMHPGSCDDRSPRTGLAGIVPGEARTLRRPSPARTTLARPAGFAIPLGQPAVARGLCERWPGLACQHGLPFAGRTAARGITCGASVQISSVGVREGVHGDGIVCLPNLCAVRLIHTGLRYIQFTAHHRRDRQHECIAVP